MNLGDLSVTLSANSAGLTTGLRSSLESIDHFAKQAKRAVAEVARTANEMNVAATAAFIAAGASAAYMERPVKELKWAGESLAISIATVVAPAMKAIGETMRTAAAYIAGLSPEAKRFIVTALEVAAVLGTVGIATSKVLGVIQGLSKLGVILLPLAAELLPIIAVLGAIVVAVLLWKAAWESNFFYIRDITEHVVGRIGDAFSLLKSVGASVFDLLKEKWDSFIQSMIGALNWVIEAIAKMVEGLGTAAKLMGTVASTLGHGELGGKLTGAGNALGAGAYDVRGAGDTARDFLTSLQSDSALPALKNKLDQGVTTAKEWGANLLAGVKQLGGDMLGWFEKFLPKKGVAPVGDEERHFHDSFTIKAEMEAVGAAAAEQTKAAKASIRSFYDLVEAAEAAAARLGLIGAKRKPGDPVPSTGSGTGTSRARGIMGSLGGGGGTDETGGIESLISGVADRFPRLGLVLEQARDAVMQFGGYMKDTLPGALAQAGQNLTSQMGKLGSTISAGVQGAQSGGVWGAIIGVLLNFFEQSKAFIKVVNTGNGAFLKALSDLSGPFQDLAGAIQTLMGALKPLTDALHVIAGGIISQIANWLKALAPILSVLGQIFAAITPLFQMLINTLVPLTPIFQLLFYAFKGVGIVIAGIILGLGSAWNAILEALMEFLLAIEGSGNWADGLRSTLANMAVDTTGASDALNTLENQTWDQAQAAATLAGSQYEAAGAADAAAASLNSFSESFQNIPSGFKIAAARYGATDPTSTANSQGGGKPGSSGITVMGDVHVNSGAGSVWDQVQKEAKKRRFQSTGTPAAGGKGKGWGPGPGGGP